MANSLELGPGMRLLAPSRSRNLSRESHCRRRTSSSSIMAMCAAGPPKAVGPSRRKNRARSRRETCFIVDIEPESGSATCSAMASVTPSCETCVQRPYTAANEQQKDQSEEHAHIRAGFMHGAPKPILRERDDFGRI